MRSGNGLLNVGAAMTGERVSRGARRETGDGPGRRRQSALEYDANSSNCADNGADNLKDNGNGTRKCANQCARHALPVRKPMRALGA